MAEVKCIFCKRSINLNTNVIGMQCPYCGSKVFYKTRPTTIKRLKTI